MFITLVYDAVSAAYQVLEWRDMSRINVKYMNAKAKTKTNAHANNVNVFGNALILINLMLSSWPITMAKMKMKNI